MIAPIAEPIAVFVKQLDTRKIYENPTTPLVLDFPNNVGIAFTDAKKDSNWVASLTSMPSSTARGVFVALANDDANKAPVVHIRRREERPGARA